MTRVSIAEHAVADSEAGPYAITTGPDGALWFTLVHSGRVGRLVPGEETPGGWFVVDVADRAEAVELARSLPTPETIEIRPLLESA